MVGARMMNKESLECENDASDWVGWIQVLVDEAVEVDAKNVCFKSSVAAVLLDVLVLPHQRRDVVWNPHCVPTIDVYTLGPFSSNGMFTKYKDGTIVWTGFTCFNCIFHVLMEDWVNEPGTCP